MDFVWEGGGQKCRGLYLIFVWRPLKKFGKFWDGGGSQGPCTYSFWYTCIGVIKLILAFDSNISIDTILHAFGLVSRNDSNLQLVLFYWCAIRMCYMRFLMKKYFHLLFHLLNYTYLFIIQKITMKQQGKENV